MTLSQDAQTIINAAVAAAQPDAAVKKALAESPINCAGKLVLVAIGKAAWSMANAAFTVPGIHIDSGIVITKYGHSKGALPRTEIYEAGHPVPDENSFSATARAIEMVRPLGKDDAVLFLVSGGGSALFELPLVPHEKLTQITKQLLAVGADITEMNTIRKRLSAVKGGRFAELCAPAHVYSVILSDVLGDSPDVIASGPAAPDRSTAEQALTIYRRCIPDADEQTEALLRRETPKKLDNVTTYVCGSVRQLCAAAQAQCEELGYRCVMLTDCLCCTARDAGSFLASIARTHCESEGSVAYIAGGETVVVLTGNGLGGRNQELALFAARGISGLRNTAVFSVGSDGTDGPTDAAGGFCDGDTAGALAAIGIDIDAVLEDNDSYHALKKVGGLIVTGPTGTNVNDLTVLLIKR